ncbi:conserved hypothetical protein [sediment metagenome]|uniref:Transcriptional regulator, AbiEi antitoxin, Type IV TA system n=1 Tax=sediment metagenome TaxID=749907 RepID=D9PJW6_9ZZZZ
MIDYIRQKAIVEEIDYNFLTSCLSGYSNPRDKIARLIKSGAIIRVKKGLYVFGPKYSRQPFSRETLANLIYGPSYISLEYALSFYGMIPERVEMVTSVTSKRNKLFKTPAGIFSYAYITPTKYNIGITQISLDEAHNIIIATKEKALADKIDRTKGINSADKMQKYILEDLRIDINEFKNLDTRLLKAISGAYMSPSVNILYKIKRGLK